MQTLNMTLKVVPPPKAEAINPLCSSSQADQGFVEFDFAIGDPSILHRAYFAASCI